MKRVVPRGKGEGYGALNNQVHFTSAVPPLKQDLLFRLSGTGGIESERGRRKLRKEAWDNRGVTSKERCETMSLPASLVQIGYFPFVHLIFGEDDFLQARGNEPEAQNPIITFMGF